MTRFVTILTEGFADWETALINGAARTFYGIQASYATPRGNSVTSAGGMRVMSDLAIEEIDPAELDALLVCGGMAWALDGAPTLSDLLVRTHQAGQVVAVICDATLELARSGLIDNRPHTSNGKGYLDSTGYKGAAHYVDGAEAVLADRIVTSAGTSPVSFMAKIMEAVGMRDQDLDYFVGLHAAQFDRLALAA